MLGPFSENTIVVGDCLEVIGRMPDGCCDLIFADPPYNKGKADWDREHDWHDWVADAVRALKPNGALWVMHDDPQELVAISKHIEENGLSLINWITWDKYNGNPTIQACGGPMIGLTQSPRLRMFQQMAEYIVYHADDCIYQPETARKIDGERGRTFAPLQQYLLGERQRADIPHRLIIEHLGMQGHDTHFFSPIQWKLPTQGQYQAMQELFNSRGKGQFLERPYPELLKRYEYLGRAFDDLRHKYDLLRPTFNNPGGISSVWAGPAAKRNWHETPKPEWLLERIISTTSNEGDLVADFFMGSGTTAAVADRLGRNFFGCDVNPDYVELALKRIAQDRERRAQLELF